MNNDDYRAGPEDPSRIFFAPVAATPRARLANSLDTQWARLSPETLVVATASSVWLYPHGSSDSDRFAQPMADMSGSVASTQSLLDGAIAAAYQRYSYVILPDLTLARWIWRLAGHYHLTCLTPTLMAEAAHRFASTHRSSLATWARQKASREKDYNGAALRDIQCLGYDAEAVISALHPAQADNLLNYLALGVQSRNPIDCVGYSYTIERIATGIGVEYIQLVEGLLPPNPAAASRPWLHGSVGIDCEDVQETVEMVAGLTAAERTCVAKACYETALLCFNRSRQHIVSDFEIQLILKTLNS
ncbi:MAG: hypothetical protein ACFB4I_09230 [Cyanophyceae cyanobacterium]